MEASARVASLSARELEIANAYSGGASYREIAERLFIAPSTVRTHLTAIYSKLGVTSKVDLFRLLADESARARADPAAAVSTAPAQRPLLRIEPFRNISADPDQDMFSEGLTEDVIARLACVRDIVVIAHPSSFEFKGQAMRVARVASDFGPSALLEGSVRRAGNRVRVTVKLTGSDGLQAWAQRFDRDLTDLFDVQDEIAQTVVMALQVQLTEGDLASHAQATTTNFEAWEAFHRGILDFLKYTDGHNRSARRLFKRAIELDPNYFDALVYHAWTYWQGARSSFTEEPTADVAECRALVDALVDRGDPPSNLLHLDAATYLLERRHAEALNAAAVAVPKGPCKFFGFTPSALVNIYSGRLPEGIELLRRTQRMAPFAPSDAVYTLAYATCLIGEYDAAIQGAEDYVKRVPTDLYAYYLLAVAYGLAGKEDKAAENIARLREIVPPGYGLDEFVTHEFFRDPADLDRVIAVLRRHGFDS